ncbi:MAG: Fur family transcriptional regulator [Microgenomates group bacterium]
MKLTKIRKKILKYFQMSKFPLGYDDIINLLKKDKLEFNRSTVFRNLDFLLNQDYLIKVNFGDGKTRYEFKNKNHHHHIVCEKCKRIIDFYDEDLDQLIFKLEKKLSKKNNIKINSHQLEFFGYCNNCI